jgi:hypothetical protein
MLSRTEAAKRKQRQAAIGRLTIPRLLDSTDPDVSIVYVARQRILVNTTLVKDLRRDNTGTYVLRTTDGREHPVGRAYKDNLKVIASMPKISRSR